MKTFSERKPLPVTQVWGTEARCMSALQVVHLTDV